VLEFARGKDYIEVIKNQPGLTVQARKTVPAGDGGAIQEEGTVCCPHFDANNRWLSVYNRYFLTGSFFASVS